MKCTRCKKLAVVKIRRHNSAFCPTCFDLFFSRQVENAIRRGQMFTRDDRILLGVSGGKDSMALWHYLVEAGYRVEAIHFDLGIGDHSLRSRSLVEEFARQGSLPLWIVEVAKEIGWSIPDLTRRIRRPTCSLCGMIKRHLLNRFAWENSFSVYTTGHNLDDEAAILLGNVLHWQEDYLAHQSPVLPSPHPKMVKKVKPFYTLTGEEIKIYSSLHHLSYIDERCPLSRKAKTWDYKEALELLEERSPGTKHMFWLGFVEKGQSYFTKEVSPPELRECSVCGMPTTQEKCSFCKTMERLERKGTSE